MRPEVYEYWNLALLNGATIGPPDDLLPNTDTAPKSEDDDEGAEQQGASS